MISTLCWHGLKHTGYKGEGISHGEIRGGGWDADDE